MDDLCKPIDRKLPGHGICYVIDVMGEICSLRTANAAGERGTVSRTFAKMASLSDRGWGTLVLSCLMSFVIKILWWPSRRCISTVARLNEVERDDQETSDSIDSSHLVAW